MSKVLVTGHLGFIGSNIWQDLKRRGFDIRGIDIKEGNDLRTCKIEGEYDAVYHLGANASIPLSFKDPIESHSHNVLATLNVLEHARKTGAKVVFSSSSSVYEMMSPYAIQKKQCESYLKWYWDQGVKCVALRYFNVFGEGQDKANGGYALALSKFINQYRNGEPFTVIGTGEQRRDFIYVGDVARANIMAAEYLDTATEFKVFDVGSGTNSSINEVLNMISTSHPRVLIPPRPEPFENRADPDKFLPGWQPTKTLKEWLSQSI